MFAFLLGESLLALALAPYREHDVSASSWRPPRMLAILFLSHTWDLLSASTLRLCVIVDCHFMLCRREDSTTQLARSIHSRKERTSLACMGLRLGIDISLPGAICRVDFISFRLSAGHHNHSKVRGKLRTSLVVYFEQACRA